MKIKDVETIIFDFDGTLADTFYSVITIINNNKERFGIDGIDPTEIPRLKGLSLKYLLCEFKINLFTLPTHLRFVMNELGKEMETISYVDGVRDVLDELQNKYTLGILTTNSYENVQKFLSSHDSLPFFKFVHSNKSIFGKHRSFNKISREHNFSLDKAIYVGDELRDIRASKKAGVKIISVAWGYNSKELLQKHEPDFLVNSPKELLELFS